MDSEETRVKQARNVSAYPWNTSLFGRIYYGERINKDKSIYMGGLCMRRGRTQPRNETLK